MWRNTAGSAFISPRLKQTIFITGTDTGAGKTVLTALATRFLASRKIRVAAFKPVCSGGRGDARILFEALAGAMTMDEINPWHFKAALAPSLSARRENKSVSLAQVAGHIRALQKGFDATIVEGAGGLLSPIGQDFNSRDLIRVLRARPIIAAPNKLGVVNHVLLTLEGLPKTVRARAKVVLISPPRPDSASATNAKLLGEFVPAEKIFTLPWLGRRFDPAAASMTPGVRRMLQRLLML